MKRADWLLAAVIVFMMAGVYLAPIPLVGFHEGWAADRRGAVIQGRFRWADNTPVTECRIKLVDKIDVFRAPEGGVITVQKIAISGDANVREMDVDSQGKFRFGELPDGNYYLFFRAPGIFEGDQWLYQYTKPANVFFVMGHMEKPDEYRVGGNEVKTIRDIELVKRLEVKPPVQVMNKPGILRFEWPAAGSMKDYRITVEHKDYVGKLRNSCYGEREVRGNFFVVDANKPLHPGGHRFMLEALAPTLRVFARSEWVDFNVPGVVHSLAVEHDKKDPIGQTAIWSGSKEVKGIQFCVQGETVYHRHTQKSIKLPQTQGSRRLDFNALDENGNELIPGWTIYFWQEPRAPKTK